MKSKAEIRKQIKHLYGLKKQAREAMQHEELSQSLLAQPFQIVDYAILALKWAIGYKTKFKGLHYYCFRCHWMHPKETCPKCGGNQVMSLNSEAE